MLFSPFSQEMSMHHTTIRLCTAADASALGELVYALIHELKPDTPITVADFIQRATQALAHPAYAAYLMLQDQDIVGFISLNECCSTYAGGAFGEITEFYVAHSFVPANMVNNCCLMPKPLPTAKIGVSWKWVHLLFRAGVAPLLFTKTMASKKSAHA